MSRRLWTTFVGVSILATAPSSIEVLGQDGQRSDGERTQKADQNDVEAAGDALKNGPLSPDSAEPRDAKRSEAIESGVAFLRSEQHDRGNWSDPPVFHGGMTAICTLALLEVGVPPTDEAVANSLARLREDDRPRMTYVVSLITRVYARAGLPEDRGRIKRNADWLVSTMIADGEFEGSWGYQDRAHEGDNSNSHYAILGLDAAELAGVEIPEGAWTAAHAYWLRAQNEDGSWGYKPRVAGTGSMTASGITSLAVIATRSGSLSPDELRNGSVRLERAYDWLSDNYAVIGNPPPEAGGVVNRWHFYCLASLTHAMRHTKQAQLDDHDLRTDVTELLLKEQQEDGSWKGQAPFEENRQMATAFALIVLANAAEH